MQTYVVSAVVVRPFAASDGPAVLDAWLDGWKDTFRPGSYKKARSSKALLALGGAVASIAACTRAGVVPARAAAAATLSTVVAYIRLAPAFFLHRSMSRIRKWVHDPSSNNDMVDIEASWTKPPNRAFFVAELEGEVVGGIALHIGSKDLPKYYKARDSGDDVGHVFRMYTSRKARSGVGRALVGQLEQYAKQQGCRVLQLGTANQAAMHFYKSVGFEIVEEKQWGTETGYAMEKKL